MYEYLFFEKIVLILSLFLSLLQSLLKFLFWFLLWFLFLILFLFLSLYLSLLPWIDLLRSVLIFHQLVVFLLFIRASIVIYNSPYDLMRSHVISWHSSYIAVVTLYLPFHFLVLTSVFDVHPIYTVLTLRKASKHMEVSRIYVTSSSTAMARISH